METVDFSTLYGQRVTDVLIEGESWQWVIVLETGATIRNCDGRRTAAPNIKGQALLNSVLEDGTLTLIFNTEEVVLTDGNYTVNGIHKRPHVPAADETVPPDPSADRIVSGRAAEEELPTREEIE